MEIKATITVLLSCVAPIWFAGSAKAGMDFGDPLVERAYASDFPAAAGLPPGVFVVEPAALPNGTLNSFQTWDQVEPGGSPFSSAGNTLTAYILQPTGNPNEFTAVYLSSLLTIPTVADSQVATFQVSPFQTKAGDRIAFYGQGVPVDITDAGSLELNFPTPTAPILGQTFTLGSPEFPTYPQNRLYSFDANVTPVPEPTTLVAGALLLLPFGASTIRILRNRVQGVN